MVRTKHWFKYGSLLAMLAAISATPVLAQAVHFGTMKLAPGFPSAAGIARGRTGGKYSLSSIANRDRKNNFCIGYDGDPTPDHTVVLEKDFEHLAIKVNSNGADTTLVVQGPTQSPQIPGDSSIMRCDEGSSQARDATVDDSNWKRGTYHIWVGQLHGKSANYTLTVQQ